MELQTATQINWREIHRFSPREWPDGVLEYMDAELIFTLNRIRNVLPFNFSMIPSPLYEGHVRHEPSGSRHSTKEKTRLSDATDIFMSWETVWRGWLQCLAEKRIGGLGFYLDTHWGNEKRPMLHLDLRKERILWVRHEGRYYYHHDDPIYFHRLLGHAV